MAEAQKKTESKADESKSDELPDEAKTASMLRREAKEKRVAGEQKLWDKLEAEREKAEEKED